MSMFDFAPFVFRKSLEISAITSFLYFITSLPVSFTSATLYASRFSSSANFINFSTFSSLTTTAILSCDSEMASSVPVRPTYFTLTLSRSISSPSASSPIATETPPAPKSLHFFISCVTSLFLNSLWIFLSVTAFPFWTSALHFSDDSVVCSFEDPVAPPIPSLPVLPPKRITTSPFSGFSLMIFSAGAAPTTSPSSNLLALYPSSYISFTYVVARPIWFPYEEYPCAAFWVITLWGSFPSSVSFSFSFGSPEPLILTAWYTNVLPDNGSLIAPPIHVDAPPNGSISVGWLCVSFLNCKIHFSVLPFTGTSI